MISYDQFEQVFEWTAIGLTTTLDVLQQMQQAA